MQREEKPYRIRTVVLTDPPHNFARGLAQDIRERLGGYVSETTHKLGERHEEHVWEWYAYLDGHMLRVEESPHSGEFRASLISSFGVRDDDRIKLLIPEFPELEELLQTDDAPTA